MSTKYKVQRKTILLQTLSYGNKVTIMSIIWRGEIYQLTHWGRVTHICVSDLTSIGSDNGLSPGRRQAIIRTNAGILLIRPLWTNFSEFLVAILIFSLKKMRLKVSSVKRRPFCLGLNELRTLFGTLHEWLSCFFIAQSVFGLPLIRLSEQPTTGPWFNIKMSSYQYRKSHCGDKTVVRSSYLHNGISYTGKTTSLYWIRVQDIS